MSTIRVGVEFFTNESQFRAGVNALAQYFISTMTGAANKVGAAFDKGLGGGAAASGEKAKKAARDTAQGYMTAAQAMEAQDRKLNAIREQYSSANKRRDRELTNELVNNTKRLQDEKQKILNAMQQDVAKEAEAELRIRKKEIEEELRLNKQVLADKDSVQREGAGSKVGMMGIGRDVLGGLPGGGVLSGLAGGGGMAVAGMAAATAGVGLLASGLMKVIDIGSAFETQMADLSSITGLSGQALQDAGQDARDLSMHYGIEATQGVESMKLVISALGPAVAKNRDALRDMTNTTLAFAKAGSIDAAEATDALTITMSQYGYATADANTQAQVMARIANVQAAASKEGAAEIKDLSASMKVAGATANAAGISIEQTAAWLEMLAPAGIKGAEAGTAFRNMVLKMSAGSKKATGALAEMGLTFDDINPKKNGMEKAMQTLKGGFDKIHDPVKKAAAMQKLFGLENANAAQVLMNSAGQVGEFTKKITNTTEAQNMADIKMNTFAESGKRLMTRLQDIAITVFQALQPALSALTDILDPLVTAFTWLVGVIVDIITWVVKANTAVFEWVATFLGLDKVIAWVKEAGVKIVEWFQGVKERSGEFIEQMQKRFGPVMDAVGKAVDWVGKLLGKLAGIVGGVLKDAWDIQIRVVKTVWGWLTSLWDIVSDGVKWVVNLQAKVIDWGASFLGLGKPIQAVIGWLKDMLSWVSNAITDFGRFIGLVDEANDKKPKPKPATPPAQTPPTTQPTNISLPSEVPEDTGDSSGGSGGRRGGGGSGGGAPKEKKSKAELEKEAYEKAKAEKEKEYDDEVYNATMQKRRLEITEEQFKIKEIEAKKTLNDALIELAKQYNQDGHKLEQDHNALILDAQDAAYAEEKRRLDDALSAKLDAISDSVDAALIDDKEANKRRLSEQLTFAKSLLELQKKYGEDTVKTQAQILSLQIRGVKAAFEAGLQGIEEEADASKKAVDDALERGEITQSERDARVALALRMKAKKIRALIEETGIGGKKVNDMVGAVENEANKTEARSEKEAEKEAKEALKKSLTYQAVFSALSQAAGMAFDFIDEKWNKLWKNKDTVLYKVVNSIYNAVKKLGEGVVDELVQTAAKFISANLDIAASFMLRAVSALISWQLSMGWWNLLLIPGELALLYGMYEGAKAVFGFAEGGIAERPIFAPFAGGTAMAGEAGPELIAPLSRLPGLLEAAGMGGQHVANRAMIQELRGVKTAVENIPTTVILDQFGNILSQEKAKYVMNKRKL